MTKRVLRAYAAAVSLVVFALVWAVVAVRPRPAANANTSSAASVALVAREQRLEAESIRVSRLVEQRWVRYRAALAARNAATPPAATPAPPQVRVVTLPALTVTRSS